MRPVIDLHCDLLLYLCHKPGRTVRDAASRCSAPQLQQGGVQLQTLAIFAETAAHSVMQGKAQVECFRSLLTQQNTPFGEQQIQILPAFENASGFASEEEPLQHALTRLEQYHKTLGSIFYISLTWNGENRFGGGVGATCGLKHDGKTLLQWLNGKKTAVDLSHASDRLAEEILNEIDARSYAIPVMASHSNFRAVTPQPRNLPDFLAKEIIARQGLIGLNLVAPFSHKTDPSVLLRHVEYALDLGAENALAFGADFFCDADFPDILQKYDTPHIFLPEYADASRMPHLVASITELAGEERTENICSKNALGFINRFQEKKVCLTCD